MSDSKKKIGFIGLGIMGKPMASQCKVIITMLPNSPEVREVCLENGIADHAKAGTMVIDMSSIDPVQTKEIGAELAKYGVEMMDAPVS